MSSQLLGKRARSNSRVSCSSPSRSPTPAYNNHRVITREPPSPDPTPNPKRVKATSVEFHYDDDSNKENIPPDPVFRYSSRQSALANSSSWNSTSDTTAFGSPMTPRAMRASRRASVQASRNTPASRYRRSSARPRVDASSSLFDSPTLEPTPQIRSSITTPSRVISRLSLKTPPPTPESTISLYTQARALLRPHGCEPAPLIGREQEKIHILDFLMPFVSAQQPSDNATSLYVSGAPGTGKTALITNILSSSPFTTITEAGNVSVRVIDINCMTLGAKDGLTGIWERCMEELDIPKETKRGNPIKIDWNQRFSKLFWGQKCILVLDEIDHLVGKTSTVDSVSQVFAIAATPQMQDCLRVIGISNTHTLTHSKVSSNTRTIHFEPYTAVQMKAVLSARLSTLPSNTTTPTLFSPATLALLAMKIATQTGDIRTVFSVARRSLDLAVAGSTSSSEITVTPAHILAALKASYASIGASPGKSGAETVTRVRNLGLHARFTLTALLLANKRITSGLSLSGSSSGPSSSNLKENANRPQNSSAPGDCASPAIDITTLHGFYTTVLSRGADAAFCGVGRSEFTDLVSLLEGSGLVELSQGRPFGSKMKGGRKNKLVQVVSIAQGVRVEELVRGLVGSPVHRNIEGGAMDMREEEVRHIWEKEIAKIGREVKAKLGNTNIKKADFEGAEED